jgi:hypothetical protein
MSNFKLYDGLQNVQGNATAGPVVLVYLAEPYTANWIGPIEFLIDTGASETSIPEDLIVKLGFSDLPELDSQEHELADGSLVELKKTMLDLAIGEIRERNSTGFLEVPVSVTPPNSQPLLGMDLLSYFDFSMFGGEKPTLIRNQKVLGKLRSLA